MHRPEERAHPTATVPACSQRKCHQVASPVQRASDSLRAATAVSLAGAPGEETRHHRDEEASFSTLLLCAALWPPSAALTAFTLPASAEKRTITVKLPTARSIQVTVDVPPGIAARRHQLPGRRRVSGPPGPPAGVPGRAGARRPRPPAPPTPTPDSARTPAKAAASSRPRRRAAAARRIRSGERQAADRDPSLQLELRVQGGRQARGPGRPSCATRRFADPAQPRLRRRAARARPSPRACRTSSSASSGCRSSCCRSTRRPGSSTACAGRSWPRSTRSRPTTAAT